MKMIYMVLTVMIHTATALGQPNTRLGDSTLLRASSRDAHVAIGFSALKQTRNTFGHTAVGVNAMKFNIGGKHSTAVGFRSQEGNMFGTENTTIGANAMLSGEGSRNVAIGRSAAENASSINDCIAIGVYALSEVDGKNNIAVGNFALEINATGSSNVAVGDQAMRWNTDGSQNTAVGDSSGFIHSGTRCTFIGASTGVTARGLRNSTAIGSGATITADNEIVVGDANVTSIGGAGSWIVFSDARFKEDVKANIPGLAFINLLSPVTYNINRQLFPKISRIPISSSEPPTRYSGFIAQEVEQAAKQLNFEFSGIDLPQNSEDFYGLRYEHFVMPLVVAIQELKKKMDDRAAIIEMQKQKILALRSQLMQ